MAIRSQIIVRGIVQGVGFRPFVYARARKRALTGRVLNNAHGVLIELEGEPSEIGQFIRELESNPPPRSSIESIEWHEDLSLLEYSDFRILESDQAGHKLVPISADVATCSECLQELFDQTNRRYRYPFINCTNCGPRFTITKAIPYDRVNTTMASFAMCADCRAEYEDPLDRRFHAEPIACAVCGPHLRFLDANSQELPGDPIRLTVEQLRLGNILAIKGLGGYHLACDGLSESSIQRLRSRKYREDKPFALMGLSVEAIRPYCRITDGEAALLESPARPIVLLERELRTAIPSVAAPGVNTLGFMLPYAPQHYLLLEQFGGPLVMTSGNISEEPICYRDEEALQRLNRIADYFLVNDREILIRTDDSVARSHSDRPMLLRRSRGYAPAPIRTAFKFTRNVLACGAELKNTFCLARDHNAFVSHHVGDLENLETLRSFTEGIEHYQQLFDITPEVVAYDLHPEYLSTKFALELDEPAEKIAVQHHHAHVASCMADNQIDGPVIGVAFDGLGYGLDGTLWGGEFFVADFSTAERVAHLANMPLVGGAKAIKEPWRLTALYLQHTFGDDFLNLDLPFILSLDLKAWATLRSMRVAGVNSPQTSSVGRLFDAVAGLLTLRSSVNYEGQAAIELENMAEKVATDFYDFRFANDEIFADEVFRRTVGDLLAGIPLEQVSARFHLSVAHMILNVALRIREERQLNRVVVSGGVFQNIILLDRTAQLLRENKFELFTHSRVPTNDGGISLGQAAIANARWQAGRSI